MKTLRYLLALSALLSLASAGRAATPTYNSFNTNQFYTNGSAPILINVVTNWPTLIVTNIYSSNIYVTNIYATNIFASNIVSGDLIWTNIGTHIVPLPFPDRFKISTNGTIEIGDGVTAWAAPSSTDALIALHNQALGEPSLNSFKVAATDGDTLNESFSQFSLNTDSGPDPFSSLDLASTQAGLSASSFSIYLQPSTSQAYIEMVNQGTRTFGVNSASGYSGTGTNFLSDDGSYKPGTGTTINPTDNFIPYRLDGATFDDSPMYRIDANTVGVDTVDANTLAATNLQSGGVIYSRSDGILTNVVNGTGFLFNDGSNTNLVWAGGSLSDICLWTNKASLLQPIDNTIPLFWTNSIKWGPGLTNSLLREGRSLVWTNSDVTSQPFGFIARDGSGAEAQFLVSGNTARVAPGSSGNAVDIYDNTRTLRFGGGLLFPTSSGVTLGGINTSVNAAWKNLELDGTNFIYGLHDATLTNYSRLALSHTGTNLTTGFITFDSQSAGTAGPPRNYAFDIGATNILRLGINPTSPTRNGIFLNAAGSYSAGLWYDSLTTQFGLGNTIRSTDLSDPNFTTALSGVTSVGDFIPAGNKPNNSALFTVYNGSTNLVQVTGSGAMLLARVTKAQKANITPAEGMVLFQTDNTPGIRVYQSGAWVMVSTVADP